MQSTSAPASRPIPLGMRLLTAIVRRDLTLAEVARAADAMPASQLSRIITGETDPRWSTLQRICHAAGIPPAELFDEDSEVEPP